MTQEAIQITETPPLPGLKLVQGTNKALQTIATDFAGLDDPAALAGPYMTWADTGNMLLKRRNATDSAWVVEGELFTYKANRNGDETQTFKAAPSAAGDDVTVQSQVFGIGQSVQDFFVPDRQLGVTYINTTGKLIIVISHGQTAAATSYIRITVNGVVMAFAVGAEINSMIATWAAVWPGATYVVENSTNNWGWREYR